MSSKFVFQGKSSLQMDGKGRLTLPAKYRDGFAVEGSAQVAVTITQHPVGCLLIFPTDQWSRFREKIAALPMASDWWKRKFIGNADDVELDSAGRIQISQELRDELALPKEVLMLGMITHLEVWDKTLYLAREAKELQSPMPDTLQNFCY